MLRHPAIAIAAFCVLPLSAQQITLDWATPLVPANQRVKTATNGEVFTLGTGDDSAVIQRLSAAGAVIWTRTLSAPTLRAVDMDVDGYDNVYVYITFETGQCDLDPGPNTTLVDPGKVYAKYSSSGVFQWGFSLENTTDASEDWGGISCDDEGNLYICGDLGEGIYDFDFGPGVTELEVFNFSTGSFMARYRPDGSLAWANLHSWTSGFSNSKDIAAMRDGSSFYIIRRLDTGGPPSEQIDVDYGPDVYNVYIDTYHILRYDSALQFMAHANFGYGDVRLCADGTGSAYAMAQAQAGGGFWAVKYSQSGQTLNEVYSTSLPVSNNLRLGDLAPDEQGGCLGMYSNNGPGGVIRFYKMNVSGLVDFNLTISCGNDYTYPSGKGFDLDGNGFYMGTSNYGYPVDFDPGPGVVSEPASSTNDGVVAHYDWCAAAPYDPFEIYTPGALCLGQAATFTVAAFGDASSYDWSVPPGLTITDGQGTGTITVEASSIGTYAISVTAVNACGTSAAITLDFTFNQAPVVDLGPDITICLGESVVLSAGGGGNVIYVWSPGGESSPTIDVSPVESTTYSVDVYSNGCMTTDAITVNVDPCLGMNTSQGEDVQMWPVPVPVNGKLFVRGITFEALIGLVGSDGRIWPLSARPISGLLEVDTQHLPPGVYLLRTSEGPTFRFIVD